MSFFGLQWVPKLNQTIRASEFDSIQLLGLAHSIRTKGKEASLSSLKKINEQYSKDYNSIDSKYKEAEEWKKYMDDKLKSFNSKEIELIQKCATCWRDGDSNYYQYYWS